MTEEFETLELEDFLKPACYMDDFYDAVDAEPDTDYENLYALPC